MSTSTSKEPPVHSLILDAGPLLSLLPLRGMAQTFYTVPQVVAELRDEKSRTYWERIQAGLIEGVQVQVRAADPVSLAKGEFQRAGVSFPIGSHLLLFVLFLKNRMRTPQ
jgi:RNA-binding protein NOB1